MALIGLTLIAASLVLFCMRRLGWFPSLFGGSAGAAPPGSGAQAQAQARGERGQGAPAASGAQPAVPSLVVQDDADADADADSASDEQTTPKASAARLDNKPVPALSLSAPEEEEEEEEKEPNQQAPALSPPAPATAKTIAKTAAAAAATATSTLMPPPPRPTAPRSPGVSASPAAPRSRNLPLPNRAPGCSTLAPPPTLTSKPNSNSSSNTTTTTNNTSRQVTLSPGHSPLDWARLSGHAQADLRGLPPGTPYLRVTPSMLRRQTGRRGKDAWTVLGGRVYNITPYLPFHPGGEPELLRGAGRDGTRLFGEVHPWVNYEGMLAACLIGIYVPEEEEGEGEGGEGVRKGNGAAGGTSRDMEAMD